MNAILTYRQVELTLSPTGRFQFRFGDVLFNTDATYEEACRHIDNLSAGQLKANALGEAVLLSDGTPLTVRSVHVGTGSFLFTPGHEPADNLFPDTPDIRLALAEYNRARRRTAQLWTALSQFRLAGSISRHHSEIAAQLQLWQGSYARALDSAQHFALPPEA